MVAAALVMLVAGVGVGFDWQPLGDGSPRSEVVVRIDPESLAAHSGGLVIPLSSDAPAGTAPAERVRVVLGRGGLPRETRMKPPSGIVYTQYTQPADGRYGAATVAPQYGAPPTHPFTQTPPAPAVDNSWNAGASVAGAAGATPQGPIQRLGAEISNATAPIQQGFDRFGNQIRTAANSLGDQTNRLLDDLGRPLQGGHSLTAGAAPPPDTAAGATTNWNPGFTTTPAPGTSEAEAGASNWNQDELPANYRGAESAGSTPPFDATWEAPPLATDGLPPSRAATDGSRWTNPAAPTTGGATLGTPPGEITTTWPGTGDAATGAGRFVPEAPITVPEGPVLGGPELAASTGDAPGAPTVRRGLLGLPPDRQLEGVDPLAAATTTPFGAGSATLATASAPATNTPAAQNGAGSLLAAGASQAGAQGWGAGPATHPSTAPSSPTSVDANARDRAAVILAWVLLFSSVAGNVYLFWSYLDVRTKYRALVRKTARAVGSRFSAA